MTHYLKKITIAIFIAVGLVCIICIGHIKSSSDSNPDFMIQSYGKGEDYYYLAEDYFVDGSIAMEKGYYEAVRIIDNSDYRIFIPIDPQTFERLPSEKYIEGTTMEIDGKRYIIHVQDNNYTASPF